MVLLARISHKLPTAAAETLSPQVLAPSSDFDVVSTTLSAPFSPRGLVGRRFDTLATEVYEKCGLKQIAKGAAITRHSSSETRDHSASF